MQHYQGLQNSAAEVTKHKKLGSGQLTGMPETDILQTVSTKFKF